MQIQVIFKYTCGMENPSVFIGMSVNMGMYYFKIKTRNNFGFNIYFEKTPFCIGTPSETLSHFVNIPILARK